MMNTAIIKEITDIVHSDESAENKLLKIEVLVGLAEKLITSTSQPAPQSNALQANALQATPQQPQHGGPIVSVESF